MFDHFMRLALKRLNMKLIAQIISTIFLKESNKLIGLWVCLGLVVDFTSSSIYAYIIIIKGTLMQI